MESQVQETNQDQWMVIQSKSGQLHVVPIKDQRKHDSTLECWCSPTQDEDVIVHHAADGRT